MKRKMNIYVLLLVMFLTSCSSSGNDGKLQAAGLLVPESISDQVWGTQGYQGMLGIQAELDVNVYYKEGIRTKELAERAIQEFSENDINLIFGHGNEFAGYFEQIARQYPNIHFVSLNGNATLENTTSLSFDGYAMGVFGGMVAAHMSTTKKIGIIAAFEWQPEVQGFVEGAKLQNQESEVFVEFTNDWDDKDRALRYFEEMIGQDVDVFYPAGDGFNIPIIEKLKEQGLYAIGYVSDQSDLGGSTVLTSTVQHVEKLYPFIADKFREGKLESGNVNVDFQDGVISLGMYSPLVEREFQEYIQNHVDHYIETGELPLKNK